MKSAGLALLLAAGAASAQQAAPLSAPAANEDWGAYARQDVEAAYQLMLANHPGVHDPANPGFPAQLKRARDAGMKIAAKAKTFSDYRDALGAFSTGLSDGHAQAMATGQPFISNPAQPREWPGFVSAWRGKLFVHHASQTSPAPAGSQILECDGRKAEEVIKKRLLSVNFRINEPGQWWSRSQQSFVSSPTFMQHRPERCTFRTPDGQTRKASLNWSPAPANLNDLLAAASDGERTSIGLLEPRPGIFLVGLPDFQPNADSVKAYRALYEALGARRPELKGAKAVILDLRHNNGGSSSWPSQAAQALWGAEAVDRAMQHYHNKVRIWWRASEGNTAYLPEMVERIRANGNVASADAFKVVADGMAAALAKGERFYVQGSSRPDPKDLPPLLESDFKAPVYVITPGRCASACLDAVDIFSRFPNVTLIGAPTSADTTYMEVRSEDLPSGKGLVVIPNKMWAGRPRASGQGYEPKIVVTDLDWSTRTFLDRIEKDLARR